MLTTRTKEWRSDNRTITATVTRYPAGYLLSKPVTQITVTKRSWDLEQTWWSQGHIKAQDLDDYQKELLLDQFRDYYEGQPGQAYWHNQTVLVDSGRVIKTRGHGGLDI